MSTVVMIPINKIAGGLATDERHIVGIDVDRMPPVSVTTAYGDVFSLIDGHHRFTAAVRAGRSHIARAIILEDQP
jgi:hypothetical protein